MPTYHVPAMEQLPGNCVPETGEPPAPTLAMVPLPDASRKGHVYPDKGLDFRLKAGSGAIDVGSVLPNVTDGFSGKAPDLGALEFGKQPFQYGPRKK